jgi:CubicO group peptidase (beta-lactamase class C family)
MTKPIAATALMMLYQDGMFRLEDPISKYLPEFADLKVLRAPDSPLDDTVPLERPPTIEDLLRHTSGLGHADGKKPVDIVYSQAGLFDLDVSPAEFVHRLAKIPLIAQPGGKWIYSMGGDVEARLVEVLSGMPFDEFLEKRLFQPLGMKDTGFWLGPEKARRLATVYWSKDGKLTPLDEEHGNPQGHPVLEAWSVNSYTVNRPRKGGSYGLVADTEDYWRFAQMLLNRGELAGERVLAPRVVDYMTCDHLGAIPVAHPSGGGYGLGFGIVKDPATAGIMSSPGTYYWGGAASTCFWIDPKEDIVVVAMTQHMKTPSTDGLFPQLCTLVNSALIE